MTLPSVSSKRCFRFFLFLLLLLLLHSCHFPELCFYCFSVVKSCFDRCHVIIPINEVYSRLSLLSKRLNIGLRGDVMRLLDMRDDQRSNSSNLPASEDSQCWHEPLRFGVQLEATCTVWSGAGGHSLLTDVTARWWALRSHDVLHPLLLLSCWTGLGLGFHGVCSFLKTSWRWNNCKGGSRCNNIK